MRPLLTIVVSAALAGLPVVGPSTAADPAPYFTARNGTAECWGRSGTSTLWHFLVFNDGTKGGRYKVEYRRDPDDELTTYSERLPKGRGINDGLVIPAGRSIDYIRVSAKTQGTIFLRTDVTGSPRCS